MATRKAKPKDSKLWKALPLAVALFLLLTLIFPVEALTITSKYAATSGIIKSPTVILSQGTSTQTTVSSTKDYASVLTSAGLVFNETAAITSITPTAPSIDGSVRASFANVISGIATLNAPTAGDLIYVTVQILGSSTVSTIKNAGTALTWTQRASASNGNLVRIETWYAYSAAAFGSQSITVTLSNAATFAIVAFGIKNADPQQFFDPSGDVPATGTGASTAQSVTVSTKQNNVLLIGTIAVRVASGNAPNPSAGTSYSNIQSNHQNNLGFAAEYASLVTAVTSYPINYSTGTTTVNWAMVGDAIWGGLTSPSVNTAFTSPTTTGSTSFANGRAGYLVSPAYSTTTTIPAGNWQLDLWASASAAGDRMEVYLLATDASYNILNSVIGRAYTGTISTSKTLITTTFAGSEVTIPSGGHVVLVLINAAGGAASFTVYWGVGQVTNFKSPQTSGYALQIINNGATSYNLVLSTYSTSSISRLTNFTMYLYSPTTTAIVINNGVITQSASANFVLAPSSTAYLAIQVSADGSSGASNVVAQLKISPSGSSPFAMYGISTTIY